MTEQDYTIRGGADMPNTEHKTTEGEIKEIWERLTKVEASIKSAHHRIDSLEKLAESVNKMAISTNRIATETKALREDYAKAEERIGELEKKPIKRYETAITALITALCGGLGGYLLALILK
jgi:chromosome segregation ATPase